MFIDAFTCCVGPVYASYLKRSLSVWMDTLDSLTVVTTPGDVDTQAVCKPYSRIRVVTTTVFKEHGASFNKGAALNIAYSVMDPVDWVLHFDSDIVPPSTWRKTVERRLINGCIHGSKRYDERGKLIVDKPPFPYGYFHLWNSNDPAARFWPLFEGWHRSAGAYDIEFLEKWPVHRRRDLDIRLTHLGEVRRNWFGVGLEGSAQEEAFKKMNEVHQIGLHEARMMARRRDPQVCLNVPDFALRLVFRNDVSNQTRTKNLIRACMTPDPFLITAKVGSSSTREQTIGTSTTPEQIRERVEALYVERHPLCSRPVT